MADPANSVAVATGSLVVTGTLTSFVAAENDIFIARGATVPIARRDGPNQITLKQPWPLASLTGEVAWSILSLGEYWRSAISFNRRLVELLAKWEIVSPFRFDEAGPLSGRSAYNNQPKGFVYAAVDQTPIQIFIKLANTNSASDWSAPIFLGSGGQIEFETALQAERMTRAQAIAAVRDDLDAETIRAKQAEAAESQARRDADAAEATARTSAIAAEAQARLAGIAAERDRATDAEGTLAAGISAEASRASAAESALGNNLASEASRATAAESALDLRIRPIEGYTTLGVGYLSAEPEASFPEQVFYRAGEAIYALDAQGVRYERTKIGTWAIAAPLLFATLSAGYFALGQPPAAVVAYDGNTIARVVCDNAPLLRTESGQWSRDGRSEESLALGYFAEDEASLVSRIVRDPEGVIRSIICVGGPDYDLRFEATASGFRRIETPIYGSNPTGTSRDISLPQARIPLGTELRPLPSANHRSPEPSTVAFPNVTLQLGDTDREVFLPGGPLASAPVIQSTDGATTYDVGTHYVVDMIRGCITAKTPLVGQQVRASGSYTRQRIDLATWDQTAQRVVVLQGSEIERNPETGAPRPGPSQVPLFRILRTKDFWEAAPLHLFDDGIRRDRQGEILAEIARGQRHLAPIVAMAMRGETIRVVWTGDSIAQMGEDDDVAWNNVNANGPGRDIIDYWFTYSVAQRQQIPQFTKNNGRTTRLHTESGYVWPLIHRLRELGAQVETYNCAINGTDSSSGTASGKFQQSHPDRMALYASLKPHLFVVATGQNELAVDATRANLVNMIQPQITAGARALILTPPLRNEVWRSTRDAWRKTCAIELQAARDLGVACVYSPHALEEWAMGSNGLTHREQSQQNANHPAATEYGAIARLGRKLFA